LLTRQTCGQIKRQHPLVGQFNNPGLAGFFTPEDMNEHETIKHIGDALSVSVVLATIVSWLPAVAAVLSIFWTAIRIYETSTVQKWLGR
jgi:hypothetical protein